MNDICTDNGGTAECSNLNYEADRAGDRYYRAMTDWLTRRKYLPDETRRVLWLGRIYDRALDTLIRCLQRTRRRPGSARKYKNAADLHAYLQKDLEILASASTNLTSETDQP